MKRISRIFAILLVVTAVSASAMKIVQSRETKKWSIGIYSGKSPFVLSPVPGVGNPVITAQDVTDVPASYVADPFMISEGDASYLFFEIMNSSTKRGEIGYAVSKDGLKWKYVGVVLKEDFHMSYPYIFKWEGSYYMLPESRQAGAIRLYKAIEFPNEWMYVGDIVKGDFVDPSILRYEGKWWLFAGAHPHSNDTLRLFYSDKLEGPWVEHRASPIVKNSAGDARPGGRLQVIDGYIIRFAQNDLPVYGSQLRAFKITKLSVTDYSERELPQSPLLKGSGKGWNESRMHTLDLHKLGEGKWIAYVDGYAGR